MPTKWSEDVHKLSTENLLLVHTFLKVQIRDAQEQNDRKWVEDARLRLIAVRRELEVRSEQLPLPLQGATRR